MHLTGKGGKRVQIDTTKSTAVLQQLQNSIKKTLWTQLHKSRNSKTTQKSAETENKYSA